MRIRREELALQLLGPGVAKALFQQFQHLRGAFAGGTDNENEPELVQVSLVAGAQSLQGVFIRLPGAGLLVAGMVSGNIEVEDPNGNLVQDTGIPANTGVMSLLELSSDTLLAGIREACGNAQRRTRGR